MHNIKEEQKKQPGLFSSVSPTLAFWFGVIVAVAAFSVVGMIILGSILLSDGSTSTDEDTVSTNIDAFGTKANTNTETKTQKTSIDLKSVRHARGTGDFTFIEYSDLECPYCKDYHPTINSLVEKYDGKIAFAYKHFPLSRHPKAKREAIAAECAGVQGKFFEYIDKIFEVTPSNNGLEDSVLFDTAAELELDAAAFRTCVDDEQFLSDVAAEAQEAQAVGGTGTPHSILVDKNGKIVKSFVGVVDSTTLSAAFDQYVK